MLDSRTGRVASGTNTSTKLWFQRALIVLCMGGFMWAPVVSAARGNPDVFLAELNERWAGARCRIRISVPLKKGKGSNGWTKSVWVMPQTQWKFKSRNVAALFWVSDRTAFPAARILPGTSFVVEGWSFDDKRKRKGLGLNLRLADEPVKVRMSLHNVMGKDPGSADLKTMERWARIDLFKIKTADEMLSKPKPSPGKVKSPVSSSSPTAVAAPNWSATANSSQQGLGSVQLKLFGVSVEPNRVRPGSSIKLMVTYRVEGKGGGVTQVNERRSIIHEGRLLTSLEASMSRAVGTHQSSQPLSVPHDIEPGLYELSVDLETMGSRSTQTALFQVLSRTSASQQR